MTDERDEKPRGSPGGAHFRPGGPVPEGPDGAARGTVQPWGLDTTPRHRFGPPPLPEPLEPPPAVDEARPDLAPGPEPASAEPPRAGPTGPELAGPELAGAETAGAEAARAEAAAPATDGARTVTAPPLADITSVPDDVRSDEIVLAAAAPRPATGPVPGWPDWAFAVTREAPSASPGGVAVAEAGPPPSFSLRPAPAGPGPDATGELELAEMTAPSRSQLLLARLRGWPALLMLSAVVTVFTWRDVAWQAVHAGLDSWQVGLVLGFQDHLQWGPHMLFTFGPYGFVEDILPVARVTATVALVYTVVIVWGLVGLVMAALRPNWTLLPAAVVAWAAVCTAGNLMETPELATAAALGLGLAAVWTEGEAVRLRLPVLLSALAAFSLLVELNVGLVTTALAVLAVLGGGRRGLRGLASLATYVAVVVVAEVAAGQDLSNFLSYLRGSLQVTLGYSSAMSLTDGRGLEDLFAVLALLSLAVVFGLSLRGRTVRLKVAVALMLVVWAWEALKEGFVRHDLHDLVFFGLVLMGLCLARLPRRLLPLQGAAIGAAISFALVAWGGVVAPMHSPVEDEQALGQELSDVVVPSHWARVEQQARAELSATGDELSPGLVRALSPFTVAAETWEVGLSYLYPQLRWRPEPVLQSYSAYTTYLDNLDASFLSSDRAPQRIVYQPLSVDGRNAFWDPPATQVAMYCHYTQIGTSGPWAVLARVPDRCGTPRPLGSLSAPFGRLVTVPHAPASNDMVLATFSVSTPLLSEAEDVLLKAPVTRVTDVLRGGSTMTNRFVTGTAADEHVLATPAALGYAVAGTPPAITGLTFSGNGWKAGQGRVTVRFTAVPLRR